MVSYSLKENMQPTATERSSNTSKDVCYITAGKQNRIQNNLNEEKLLHLDPGTTILKIKDYALANIWLNISKTFEEFYIIV